jgi:hypothetical protein
VCHAERQDRLKKEVEEMKRLPLFIACVLALAPSAVAQTKVAGAIDCDKGDPSYAIPIPDREGFAFLIDQNKCTWPKGGPIEGLQPKELVNTRFIEVTGASSHTTASGVTRYDNGDQLYTRSTGPGKLKALVSSGKWTIVGGTGKLAGIKGGGTYTCKLKSADPRAGYTCDVVGEYTVPAPKK